MGFMEGTITSATPATALIAAVEAEFALHDNWDFVEEVIASGTVYRIWKNRGSGLGANAFGQDFYVALLRATAGTGQVMFEAFELWDTGTKMYSKPCAGYAANQVPSADGSWAGSDLVNTATLVWVSVLTKTSAVFDYLIQVSKDRLVVGTKFDAADYGVYAGLFESLIPAEPFPLCLVGDSVNDNIVNGFASWSRHPTVMTARTNNFQALTAAWTSVGGTAVLPDRFFGSDASASRVLLRSSGTAVDLDGFVRGLLRGMMWLPDGTTALRNNSVAAVGAEQYSRVRMTGSCWVRRAEP